MKPGTERESRTNQPGMTTENEYLPLPFGATALEEAEAARASQGLRKNGSSNKLVMRILHKEEQLRKRLTLT